MGPKLTGMYPTVGECVRVFAAFSSRLYHNTIPPPRLVVPPHYKRFVSSHVCCCCFVSVAARPSYQDAAVTAYLANKAALPPAANFNASGRGFPDVAALGHNYFVCVISAACTLCVYAAIVLVLVCVTAWPVALSLLTVPRALRLSGVVRDLSLPLHCVLVSL